MGETEKEFLSGEDRGVISNVENGNYPKGVAWNVYLK